MLAAAAAAGSAGAQAYVRPDCRPFVAAASFDDDLHRRWYVSFWDGRCAGLPFFCRRESWNDAVGKLVARAEPAARPEVLRRACALGRLVGHEWARDNGKRRIDTDELRAWGTMLKRPGDPLAALRRVEDLARRELAGG